MKRTTRIILTVLVVSVAAVLVAGPQYLPPASATESSITPTIAPSPPLQHTCDCKACRAAIQDHDDRLAELEDFVYNNLDGYCDNINARLNRLTERVEKLEVSNSQLEARLRAESNRRGQQWNWIYRSLKTPSLRVVVERVPYRRPVERQATLYGRALGAVSLSWSSRGGFAVCIEDRCVFRRGKIITP